MYVPFYDNLTLKHISQFCNGYPQIGDYLPDPPDLPKVPKQWIINVCSAVIGQPFRSWVAAQIEARNALMASKKDVMISMDPEMAAKL